MAHFGKAFLMSKSLSSWRAWIEMEADAKNLLRLIVALLMESVD